MIVHVTGWLSTELRRGHDLLLALVHFGGGWAPREVRALCDGGMTWICNYLSTTIVLKAVDTLWQALLQARWREAG